MALLPLRLQRILFSRLDRYNCVSKQHPRELQRLAVAISSGGSYKSLHNWCYLPASLFTADFSAKSLPHPFILQVTDAPHFSLANGPYLKTTSWFNGFPVYAQITQAELMKKGSGLEHCVQSPRLLEHLKSTAPNANDPQLRAGERLLVRQQNAWVVQSVTAYRGFSTSSGACGFHLLQIPEDPSETATCFAGMGLDMKPIMDRCPGKVAPFVVNASDFIQGSKFTFDFGSCRIVRPTVSKGTAHRPRATRFQEFHTDGPFQQDASSIWKQDGTVDWKSDACLLSRLESLSVGELRSLCLKRKLKTQGLGRKGLLALIKNWFVSQPSTPLPVPESLFQSLSALFAFYPGTALGVPAGAIRWTRWRLNVSLGTAVMFRFDFFHHGWSCIDPADPDALPVHFRAHLYLLSGCLPSMPFPDIEAAIEYLSAISHPHLDEATGLVIMECFQTFVPFKNLHTPDDHSLQSLRQLLDERKYKLFPTQQDLDNHCRYEGRDQP
jgi:hypothetical protein